MPAEAGTHDKVLIFLNLSWGSAFAGMTKKIET
jgi:hypothetical protein